VGTQVFYIGLLSPLDRPMARSGTIGALDQEGIDHKDGFTYTAHLVDCRSYGGFSGSPVFAAVDYALLEAGESILPAPYGRDLPPMGRVATVHVLAGMFTQHLTDRSPGGPVSLYGVGVMLRDKEIKAAIMSDGMKAERRERDALIEEAEQNDPILRDVGGST
jgi:hypothetical protein